MAEQDARIVAIGSLYHLGKTEAEICSILGLSKTEVRSLECRAGYLANLAEGGAAMGRSVVIPASVLSQLGGHAAQRGISANTLARRIVEFALRDNLVDAIMDDGEEASSCPA